MKTPEEMAKQQTACNAFFNRTDLCFMFTPEMIANMHKDLVAEFGGSHGVRDIKMLESAVQAPYAAFGDEVFYKTHAERGARFGYSLIANHPFIDGNKRTGMVGMLGLLKANGVNLSYTSDEIFDIIIQVADGKADYEELLGWVNDHTVKTKGVMVKDMPKLRESALKDAINKLSEHDKLN